MQKETFLTFADLAQMKAPEKVKITRTEIWLIDGRYPVPRDRCRTYHEILGWVLHVSQKKWMDRESIRQFIEAATEAAGLERPKA